MYLYTYPQNRPQRAAEKAFFGFPKKERFMYMKNFKRVLAALLTAVMLFAMIPVAAFADTTASTPWLQMESVRDPETGKATLTIKLNMDKIKQGNLSGLKIDDIFKAVLGDKDVKNSGLISMADLLKIFPIVYEVDGEGKAVASSSSVLDVVGATAIIGLPNIVETYVNDLGALITANKETLKKEIKFSNILDAVSTNTTLRDILKGYFDTPEERDLYMTEAGRTALAGIAGKTRDQVFAELTANDYKDFFNKGYLNFDNIVDALLDDLIEAISLSSYPNISDYLTSTGLSYVNSKKFDIVKYLLENGQVTVQELSDHLIITVDNVKNIIGDEKDNFSDAIFKSLFGTTYVKAGQEANLAKAIREGKDLWQLADYLKLNDLLETGFGKDRDAIMVTALNNTGGLVANPNGVLVKIRDSESTVDDFIPLVDTEKMVAALGITKEQVKEKIGTPLDDPGIVTNWPAVAALGEDAEVNAYLEYLDVAKLLAAIYGSDAAAKNAIALKILTASSLVDAGSETAVLTLVKNEDAEIDDFIDYIKVGSLLTALGISYVDIYEKLLQDVSENASAIIKSGMKKNAAIIIDANKDDFDALITAMLAGDSPLKSGALTKLVHDFVNEIETGSDTARKTAFENNAKAKIQANPTTYIANDGVNALFGSKLIYYFFDNVDASTGEIDGQKVDYYLDLNKVVALLNVTLSDTTTLKEKILSEAGYNKYLTAAGRAFVDKQVTTGTAAKELETLYSDYETYFDVDALFSALVVDSDFTNIVFNDPQEYVTVKGMNTILQYWLTVEGADSKDMTNIINTLQKASKTKYKTTNGELVEYDGKKLLSNAIVKGFSKFFENTVDLVIDGKDIADTVTDSESSSNRHLKIDGTALMERIYNVILPTIDEIDGIGSDGYLKTVNLVVRAQEDNYYWGENEAHEKVYPPQNATTGDLEYIMVDLDVKIYLTGDLSWIKKPIARNKTKIQNDFDFEYLRDYTYDLYKDTAAYAALTKEEKETANGYNKVNILTGDDSINLNFDLPYFLTFVYRNLAESNLDAAIKVKLYDFVYNKTPNDLIDALNRFTVAELQAMVEALDLDAIMEEFSNDPRGKEYIMLIFDFIGDENEIWEQYKNPDPTDDAFWTKYLDPYGDRKVTAEWSWYMMTHDRDLEQAVLSRGGDPYEIAALLDSIMKNKLFSKFFEETLQYPVCFTDIVTEDINKHVGIFLRDVTYAIDRSATNLMEAFENPAKTFKDVLKAFVSDEFSNIQKNLKQIFSELPTAITDSAFKDFYMGSSLFQSESTDSSKNTYVTLDEYQRISKGLKNAFNSAGFGLTSSEIATIVDGFIGNLSTDRLTNISVKQNGLYKVTFYGLDGTTVLLSNSPTFLPQKTDPAKAYQDPEVKTGYVFSGWSLTLGGARIDETPSNDEKLYPIYVPDLTIDYSLNLTFDTVGVSGSLVGGNTRHYNDFVTLGVTGITPASYKVTSIEYKLPGDTAYTSGSMFTMPMGDVDVLVHVKDTTVSFSDTGFTDGVIYPAVDGDPIVIDITTPGVEIDEVKYPVGSTNPAHPETTYKLDPTGKLKDEFGNELTAIEGETDISVTVKKINYTVSLDSVTANDSAAVSASLSTSLVDPLDPTAASSATVFHYGDLVKLDVTGITPADYSVNYIEYSLDGGATYHLYDGTPISMPAHNLLVNVYLYAPVSFNTPAMTPLGTTATVNPTSVGEPIVITGVTPGYEVTTVIYGGVIYTVDPVDGELKAPNGKKLVAEHDASDIKVILTPIHYTITVNYSVPGVTGDLVDMTDKTVENTITLAVNSLNTTDYKVSYITYRLADSTAETTYTAPFTMLPGNLVVTVYLTSTAVPTPLTPTPTYQIDDIEVSGDVVVGDETVDATVSFDKPSYKPGDVVEVTVSDIEEGYELDYIAIVEDGEETPIDGTSFVMPDGKVGVKVYTKRQTYEYSIAGVPDSGLYKDTISFTVTVKEGEVLKEVPEGCVLVSAKVKDNGEMELTYVFSLTENGKDINYRIGDLSYRTLKITNGIEWIDEKDPTGENGAAFKGWSALVGETYLFATFEKTAKQSLWWLWILLIILILIALEAILYRKDEKDGREKGGFWKVIRAIGDAIVALSKAFYGLFHKKA